ncbi:MAG TPA: peptidoglycan DD-metalloendopeptidase family protein [Candidatus Binataceae bacterium]|nr:peptidoglycan DD-metalloendopeptidase family protein [Candidatus Binataceae bacterium]
MLRGKHNIQWRRTTVALVAAGFVTVAAVRLLLLPESTTPDQSAGADAATEVAGRLDSGFVGAADSIRPAPEAVAISLTLDRTQSADAYFQAAGLESDAARRWEELYRQVAGSPRFEKGHALTIFRDPETGDLRGFRYNLDDRIAITGKTYGEGVLRSSQELIRYTFRPVVVAFRLHNDFWNEAGRHNLPRPIVDTLANAFRDDHPLSSLPRGADVRLIYQEKVSRDGSTRFATGIQAATISFGGRTLTAFAFRDERGEPRLYDANGVALGPEALRFPLNFKFISSGFSLSRYHPILHRYRAHEGVDLVARYGTPVKAVADGEIEQAGWCGELGRCVRIRHEGGIVSVYGHLSRITSGIDAGRRVRTGEQIGEVGSTGLSTGPHLHYGIEKDGHYVNPLNQDLGVRHQVSPRLRAVFDSFKHEYLAMLNHLPLSGRSNVAFAAEAAPIGVIDQVKPAALKPKVVRGRLTRHAARVEPIVATSTTVIDGRASVMR